METFDHVIVGGGVLGLSVAYHLAQDSQDSVLVVERNELAGAASSQAAGLILQATAKPLKTPLAKRTRDTIPVLEEALGETIGFHGVGSLRIAASPACVAELESMERDASKHGIPFRHMDHAEACAKAPWLDPSTTGRITFFPTDGYVDPYLFSTAYGRAARRLGAQLRPRCAVHDLITQADRVVGVRTATGDIHAGSVIDTAGAWASLISARAGFALPMAPTRSHYWIAAPNTAYGGDFPATVMPDVRAYVRPEVGGMVVGVQELKSATFDARALPDAIDAFSPTPGEEHWDVLTEALDDISAFFPALPQTRFSSYVSGLSTYTPDGSPLLGAVPGATGFFAAAGCCGSGITLSAGIGSAISALARGEEPGFDLQSFAPGRFGRVDPFSPAFRDRCAAARGAKSRKQGAGASFDPQP